MILTGKIKSGEGDFAIWLDKLAGHYTRKLGVKLFPGTLNVHLVNQNYQIPCDCIRLEKEEYGGIVSVSIVKCTIFDKDAFILRTDCDTGKLGDPPESILEIASEINLRQTYGLKDEDIVEIEINDTGN